MDTIEPSLSLRSYTKEDVPALVKGAMEEVSKLPNYKDIRFDEKFFTFTLLNNLTNNQMFCVVLCDSQGVIQGGIMAYLVTMFIAPEKATSDIFLFIREEHRTLVNAIRLINAYKDWGLSRNAKVINATLTSGYREEELGRLLERLGFKRTGTLYRLDN